MNFQFYSVLERPVDLKDSSLLESGRCIVKVTILIGLNNQLIWLNRTQDMKASKKIQFSAAIKEILLKFAPPFQKNFASIFGVRTESANSEVSRTFEVRSCHEP